MKNIDWRFIGLILLVIGFIIGIVFLFRWQGRELDQQEAQQKKDYMDCLTNFNRMREVNDGTVYLNDAELKWCYDKFIN